MMETDRLSIWMAQQGLDISWWENVKLEKQDPWEKLRANDPNNQMKQFKMRNGVRL
jgi:hypothetical protein